MTKILFLNDTIDYDNWGAHACTEWLKTIIKDTIPDVNFINILSHWTTDEFYRLPWWKGGAVENRRRRIIGRFSKHILFLPKIADDFEYVADQWCNGEGGPFAQEFLSKLKQSDAVVFNAEGATYNNNSSAIRCLFALWLTVKRFQKPAFFTNGSVTLTRVYPVLNAMVQRTFSRITSVSVREPCSLENARKWIPGVDVMMFPDSVFYSALQKNLKNNNEPNAFLERLKGKEYFCFSLSMLISTIGGFRTADIDKTALYNLIMSLKKLVPNAVLMAKDRMDQAIIKDLVKATSSIYFGPEHHYSELASLYQNARFMISGRFHHLILATIAGCPAIPFRTTSHKVDGLCRLVQPLLGEPFDPTWVQPVIGEITEKAREAIAEGEDLRQRLRDKALELGSLSAGIGKMIQKGIAE